MEMISKTWETLLVVKLLWIIPAIPMLAAGVLALTPRGYRRMAASLAIGSMVLAFLFSCLAFYATMIPLPYSEAWRQSYNVPWFDIGHETVRVGWVLDPLSALMLAMVTFVGTCIFVFSTGYMAEDENFTRFFGFLTLFAGAMLGLIISNSLLLLFICWELVGLASYLLIGFWFHKPSAAAAAKKAFMTTRIGDLGLLIGMVWLYSETGTLLFYDGGFGCLETKALIGLVTPAISGGTLAVTGIALLIFCGAIGKSGQFPLHVWLPDAMEGPTPVSALIHAATMVAAGVFLVGRMLPLMGADMILFSGSSPTLYIVAMVGSFTALFAALIAVAQTDIKRILAYSTVSQLGYMMMAIGVGGYPAAIFHLLTHAFFKALLFLGSGSVIHGCHHEQDIRRMGGIAGSMKITFATYAVGMMALSGVPFFFSGFWSKEAILHAALTWTPSMLPFIFGLCGAFLTAFYMTRMMGYVFFGNYRGDSCHAPHESPATMTVPLVILAVFAVLLGFAGTSFWPWCQSYLTAQRVRFGWEEFLHAWPLTGGSIAMVAAGIGLGWKLYISRPVGGADAPDILETMHPKIYNCLKNKFFVDEFYAATWVRWCGAFASVSDWMERFVWGGMMRGAAFFTACLALLNSETDERVVNGSFDGGCKVLKASSGKLSLFQNGKAQRYLCVIGAAFALLLLALEMGVNL